MNYRIIAFFLIIGGISGVGFCQEAPLSDLVVEENIKGTTLNKDGQVHFEAKKALFNKSDMTLEMQDDVKIETQEGLRLETDAIKWNQNNDKVFTDQRVKITKQEELQIEGRGLDAKPSLKRAKIEEEVEVRIPQEDSTFIMITCNGPLEIDYQEGVAVFYNDVRVNQKDSQLFSDKATMYFDLNTRSIDKIVAEGNVRIIRGKDTSYSEKATYDPAKKKVVLEGSPRLVIFPDEDQDKTMGFP
ncbi:MAG: LPS export ABC transporter periplasmic protein LptC [Candidatus Omnitrophica bacterium]|nr:LPS export ABC transporter periplasmic protein LptC [Candidatus Omnitrophota bacterium]